MQSKQRTRRGIIVERYKKDFIKFMVRSEVLNFGHFVTKSGRSTPYFINTGNYRTGPQIEQLGAFYAEAILDSLGDRIDILFGPAYKGIPLVVTTAIALSKKLGKDISFCFNRKELKDHGEGGSLVGQNPSSGSRVLIVEDVTTAGTSIRETVPILKSIAPIELAGLIISVDRQERGQSEQGALKELQAEFNMPTGAIVTLDEIVGYLHGKPIDGKVVLDNKTKAHIDKYRARYGSS
jgi:orotate phosphoribosyltransferase